MELNKRLIVGIVPNIVHSKNAVKGGPKHVMIATCDGRIRSNSQYQRKYAMPEAKTPI